MKNPGFTEEQKAWICDQIGDWYISWKNRLVNYEDKTHRLGFAKEILKTMICDTKEDQMKMLADIAAGLVQIPHAQKF